MSDDEYGYVYDSDGDNNENEDEIMRENMYYEAIGKILILTRSQ